MRQKRIFCMVVALLLALALAASAQASVTTKKSGPAVGTHKAQRYVLNLGTNVVTNKSTGKEVTRDGLRGLPPLFPGDTVEFRSSEGAMGYEFYDSNGDPTVADRPGKDGKTHVHVTGTASFGILSSASLTRLESSHSPYGWRIAYLSFISRSV